MKYPASTLLRLIGLIVPSRDRLEWIREWDAELEYLWSPVYGHRPPALAFYLRVIGSAEDALWLRTNQRKAAAINPTESLKAE